MCFGVLLRRGSMQQQQPHLPGAAAAANELLCRHGGAGRWVFELSQVAVYGLDNCSSSRIVKFAKKTSTALIGCMHAGSRWGAVRLAKESVQQQQ
jgi:hypothetical protein